MSDHWQHAGDVAHKVTKEAGERSGNVVEVTCIEQARKGRLAALAAQADELRQRSDTCISELRRVMEEMNRLSPNYAAAYVEQVKRERRHAR